MINKNKYDYCYSDSYKCTANKYLCSISVMINHYGKTIKLLLTCYLLQ